MAFRHLVLSSPDRCSRRSELVVARPKLGELSAIHVDISWVFLCHRLVAEVDIGEGSHVRLTLRRSDLDPLDGTVAREKSQCRKSRVRHHDRDATVGFAPHVHHGHTRGA